MSEKYGTLIICAAILVLCFTGTASAETWYVDDGGGEDFTGIQDAINNASVGDTIIVYSGIYYENVVVNKLVILKGIGYPIVDASGEGSAITLTADGITLEGFNVTNSGSSFSDAGIEVTSNNNIITGNNASNNDVNGIALYDSNNNTITGNTFVNSGLFVMLSYQNTVEDNTVNGKPLVYLEDASDYKVEDAGQVILVNCNNITVENLDISNTNSVIELFETGNSIISNNTASNNEDGIWLILSNNNTITGNNVCNNGACIRLILSSNNSITGNNVNNNSIGISLLVSSNNTFSGNNVSNNNYGGIHLDYSSNNTITGNNVSNNNGWHGIHLDDSSNNNTITGNNVSNNDGDGIHLSSSSNNNTITGNNVSNHWDGIGLDYSSNNKIYFNNLINNIRYNVDSYESTTIWNSPLEITYTYDGTTYKSYIGNYWDDYEGTDVDGDGIGDTSHAVALYKHVMEVDWYPLMEPWENYILP